MWQPCTIGSSAGSEASTASGLRVLHIEMHVLVCCVTKFMLSHPMKGTDTRQKMKWGFVVCKPLTCTILLCSEHAFKLLDMKK